MGSVNIFYKIISFLIKKKYNMNETLMKSLKNI